MSLLFAQICANSAEAGRSGMTKDQRQLVAEIRKLAAARGLHLRVAVARGKGSHVRVYVDERHTIMPAKVKPNLRRPRDYDYEATTPRLRQSGMRSYVYAAQLTSEPEGGASVNFPDVPEAFGCGDDRQEALATAREGLADALLTYIELGRDIPEPATSGGSLVPVALPAQVAAKLAVWQAWRAAGISKSELARRLGVGETEARRILDPDHATSLERLDAALAALGQRLVIGVDRAA